MTDDDAAQQFSCLYFGFASNLSSRSIKQRCPSAMYAGLAVLKGWKFITSEVGFGNIVPGSSDDIVYGSLSFLSKRDEDALDKSEEVPNWHEKMKLNVTRLADPNVLTGGQEIEVTTYVDVNHVKEGVMSKEYISFVRKAIADGMHIGVPATYFQKYWQQFLPKDDDVGKEDQIMMIRTIQMDKHNTGYVPSDLLKLAGGKNFEVNLGLARRRRHQRNKPHSKHNL